MITRETVREKMQSYLNREITIKQLVDWAEDSMVDAEFDPKDVEMLSDVVGGIGVADVEGFELSWEDISSFFSTLGSSVTVQVMTV